MFVLRGAGARDRRFQMSGRVGRTLEHRLEDKELVWLRRSTPSWERTRAIQGYSEMERNSIFQMRGVPRHLQSLGERGDLDPPGE